MEQQMERLFNLVINGDDLVTKKLNKRFYKHRFANGHVPFARLLKPNNVQ